MKRIYYLQHKIRLEHILYWIAIMYTASINASMYGPGLLFSKPYSDTSYEANYCITYSSGKTSSGYNQSGQVVPFLQEYGTEDFLRKFIDPTLPKDNIEKLGTITVAGNFTFQQVNFWYTKNIHKNLFFGIGTSLRNLHIKGITPEIQLFNENLTPQESLGIELFKAKIPKNINLAGIYTAGFNIGYNKIFTDFQSIDFLHLYISGGFYSPQSFTGDGITTLLQFPIGGNITFSYPAIMTLVVGLLNHVNFGLYGMFLGLQPTQVTASVNTTASNNHILLVESTRIQLNPQPIFSAVGYLEIHNIIPQCMITLGYGAAHGMAWSISSFDQTHFPNTQINNNKTLSAWGITSMFFQLSYDLATENHPHAPAISFAYTVPINGFYYPKMNVGSGSYNLSYTYEF